MRCNSRRLRNPVIRLRSISLACNMREPRLKHTDMRAFAGLSLPRPWRGCSTKLPGLSARQKCSRISGRLPPDTQHRPHHTPDGFGDNEVMTKTLQAVYENGVLRPLEPLPLKEHQRVMVTVSDPAERWLDQEYMEKVKKDVAGMGPAPSLAEVRQALSKIPGNLSDDIRVERESR